jgi:Holliday junction DNA helicase RuvA
MIARLRGLLDSVGKDWIVIDVGGVGYEVSCPAKTLARLPAVGEPVTLSIETHVREDAIKLYGFSNDEERIWFRLLQSVPGVGAKLALAILGTLDGQELTNAIALQDRAAVARTPGVGPKVALRIINELKDKAPLGAASADRGPGAGTASAGGARSGGAAAGGGASPVMDAISALSNLGYSPSDAGAAIAAAVKKAGDSARAEELIRLGLKELAR